MRFPAALLAILSLAACNDADVPARPDTPVEPELPAEPRSELDRLIRLPPGFHIDVWAENIPRVRSLALADDGTVFGGTYFFTKGVRSPVYALRDEDGDNRAERLFRLGRFGSPNGVAFYDGTLFVSDEDKVWRMPDVLNRLANPQIELISSAFPSRAETDLATNVGHFWRELTVGPDGKVYVSVGTRWSFLVGSHVARDLSDPPVYSTIMRMNRDGSGLEMFADGVRNSMGLAFHPVTGDLWFTDNGPSWPFEDPRFYDIPSDELNRAVRVGQHFGFPYVHAALPDPLLGDRAPAGVTLPEHEFAAHTAPLGLAFYTGTMFPERYRNQIFVAEHGTEPTTPAPAEKIHGNRIGVVMLDDAGQRAVGYEVFADGLFDPARARFATNERYTRRPMDLLVLPDGSLLVSDDWQGKIYRIVYDP